jgi:hypothetical protein
MTNDVRDLTLKGVPLDVAEPLLQYVAALNELDYQRHKDHILGRDTGGRYAWYGVDPEATSAGKYLRIVMAHSPDLKRHRSVHAFIEKATGKVIKAAGWQGPAKSTAAGRKGELLSQYTLNDPDSLAKLLANIDPFGAYLYSR